MQCSNSRAFLVSCHPSFVGSGSINKTPKQMLRGAIELYVMPHTGGKTPHAVHWISAGDPADIRRTQLGFSSRMTDRRISTVVLEILHPVLSNQNLTQSENPERIGGSQGGQICPGYSLPFALLFFVIPSFCYPFWVFDSGFPTFFLGNSLADSSKPRTGLFL